MSVSTSLDAQVVGARAAQIFRTIEEHPLYTRLTESSLKYTSCWFTTTGYATIAQWDIERDAPPLAIEGLRVLAIKAAVYELTGDEVRAELLVPAPVDEMIHAILAQWNVMTAIQKDLDVTFVHATELEKFTYYRGCETDEFYAAAGWGPQPMRYWLTSTEVNRRLAILGELYKSIGIDGFGRKHEHTFDEDAVAA